MRLTGWLFSVLLFITTASAADFTGTWKLNLAKSKPNDDLLAQTTKTEQIDSRTTRTTIDQEYKSGRMRHQEVIRIWDGQEHPSQGVAIPEGASEICEIVDGNTRKMTQKIKGKITTVQTSTISADGKVMTTTRTQGQDRELVFDRSQ